MSFCCECEFLFLKGLIWSCWIWYLCAISLFQIEDRSFRRDTVQETNHYFTVTRFTNLSHLFLSYKVILAGQHQEHNLKSYLYLIYIRTFNSNVTSLVATEILWKLSAAQESQRHSQKQVKENLNSEDYT